MPRRVLPSRDGLTRILQATMFFIWSVWFIIAPRRQRRGRITCLLVLVATVAVVGTAATQQQGLVSRGTERPSFDCAMAKSAAARLICADGELTRLDRELGTAFQGWKAQLPESDQPGFVASQLAWIKGRNARCGLDGKTGAAIEVLARSKPCMANESRERINDFSSSSGAERPNSQGAEVPAVAPSAPSPADDPSAVADLRKHNVDTCTESVDLVNELIRSGTVTGRETVGEQRKAKIDACVADSEAKLQAALKKQQLTAQPAAGAADDFGQSLDPQNTLSSPSRDAELLAQGRKPEANSLGTTLMMLYVMVNCKELDERDAEVLINAELRKLKAIDPRVQLKIAASAKWQAEAKTNPQVCARLDQLDVFKIKQAVREEKIRAGATDGKTQANQPSAKQNSYAEIYYNEVRRQKLEELDREVRSMYFAIGCGVINEERAAWGLLSAKMGLVWPEAGGPLFNLSQRNQFVGGQALFFGIPPETVDDTYMSARRAGLVAAGADPDASVVREFRTGVPGPPMAIPLYSGPIGANCEYWRENAENVTSVYSLANFLNRRATSGLTGYP